VRTIGSGNLCCLFGIVYSHDGYVCYIWVCEEKTFQFCECQVVGHKDSWIDQSSPAGGTCTTEPKPGSAVNDETETVIDSDFFLTWNPLNLMS